MTKNKIEDTAAALAFLLAGNATFTVRNESTGGRFTFRVRKVENDDGRAPVHFVDVLTGPSNEADFSRLGMIFEEKRFVTPRAWNTGAQPSAAAFRWVFGRLQTATDLSTVEFWHEGRCGRCNRKLTVPESIDTGLGPICADKVAA